MSRKTNLAFLAKRGFRVAASLPIEREAIGPLRPVREIALRLMALDAVFTWVVYDDTEVPAAKLRGYVRRNQLERWMTRSELRILRQKRPAVHRAHVNAIGWRLENMWPLAWVLGFPRAPGIDGAMIKPATTKAIVAMLPKLSEPTAVILERARPRALAQVADLEDRFYCAHNAVRSAQLGKRTVPKGFDLIVGGGAIHERRHALTWCLSANTTWDDTDLST